MPKSGKLFTPKRKQRTRSHIIADLSVNYVERFVLLNGDSCVSITRIMVMI